MRMNRRNVLLGLGSLATISGGAIGTGAFSQVSAPRSAKVSVASDANAYLMLDATNSTSPLVGQTSGNKTIAFDFSGGTVNSSTTVTGEGINPQSTTSFPYAFKVGNHGTAGVGVQANITSWAGSPSDTTKETIRKAISFDYVTNNNGTASDPTDDTTVDLLKPLSATNQWTSFDVGESGWVHVTFDFTGTDLTGNLVNEITFMADKNEY